MQNKYILDNIYIYYGFCHSIYIYIYMYIYKIYLTIQTLIVQTQNCEKQGHNVCVI